MMEQNVLRVNGRLASCARMKSIGQPYSAGGAEDHDAVASRSLKRALPGVLVPVNGHTCNGRHAYGAGHVFIFPWPRGRL
jgi:hypothetical protein